MANGAQGRKSTRCPSLSSRSSDEGNERKEASGAPPEGMDEDEDLRKACAASLESHATRPSAEEEFEKLLRQAEEASMRDAAAATNRASSQIQDLEERIRRAEEESLREHEKQERRKAQRERDLARKQEEEWARVMEDSQRAAQESGHLAEEDDFAKAVRLSQEANAEDVRRAAERMSISRSNSTHSASWTEGKLASARQHGASDAAPSSTTPAAPAETTPKPATKPKTATK
ncbi:MAG: hypothetical protein Q9170_006311, partial [Blastenia crenularia]